MAAAASDLVRLLNRWQQRGGDDARTAGLVALAELLPALPVESVRRAAEAISTKQARETLAQLPDLEARLAAAFAARAAELAPNELESVLKALGAFAPQVVAGLKGSVRRRGVAHLRQRVRAARSTATQAEALADLAELVPLRERRALATEALAAVGHMRPSARRVALLARLLPLLARQEATTARKAAVDEVAELRPKELESALAALLPALSEQERMETNWPTWRLRQPGEPWRLARIGRTTGDKFLAREAVQGLHEYPPHEQALHAGRVVNELGRGAGGEAIGIAIHGLRTLSDPHERALGLERLNAASGQITLQAPLLTRAGVRESHLISATAQRARDALVQLPSERSAALGAQLAEAISEPTETWRESYVEALPILLPVAVEPLPTSGAAVEIERATQKRRFVSSGFAAPATPSVPLGRQAPLEPSSEYLFWLQVGRRVQGSIESKLVELDMPSSPGTRLDVVVFGFDGGLAPTGRRTGQLVVLEDGSMAVAREAAPVEKTSMTLLSRLFFRVATPAKPGPAQLRCNIYCNGLLLQSRVVTAHVGNAPARGAALSASLDYALSRSLTDDHVAAAPEHALSVLVNENAAGTHQLRIAFHDGTSLQPDDVSIEPQALDELLKMGREALRYVTWKQPDEPPAGGAYLPYRYAGPADEVTLKDDLVSLAKVGVRLWDDLIGQLAGGEERVDELTAHLVAPASIQIASKSSMRFVIPASLFYDYPSFRDTGDPSKFDLCEEFRSALARRSAEGWRCLDGQCPARGTTHTVCPSGFWGYRHRLGFPPSATEDVTFLAGAGGAYVAGINPTLAEAAPHLKELQKLGGLWQVAQDIERVIALLKSAPTLDLAYFYCHGGIDKRVPFLQFGREGDDGFTAAALRQNEIKWDQPGPLVFINGCGTAALAPENALDLVSRFVDVGRASGVIGTEITVYENLARPFAVRVLESFLDGSVEIGEAVRRARVQALIEDRNPLALAYIPFVVAGLRRMSH